MSEFIRLASDLFGQLFNAACDADDVIFSISHYITLLSYLLDQGRSQGCHTLARLTFSRLFENDFTTFQYSNSHAVCQLVLLTIRLQERFKDPLMTDLVATFVDKTRDIDEPLLTDLMLKIGRIHRDASSGFIVLPDDSNIYRRMCAVLVCRNLTSPSSALKLFKCLVWLNDEPLVWQLLCNLCAETDVDDNVLTIKLIQGYFYDKDDSRSDQNNRMAVQSLLSHRIDGAVLNGLFWRQPVNRESHFSVHPLVAQFLRSERPEMTYANFNSLAEARDFADEFFGGEMLARCYSAVVSVGGCDAAAYCHIVKWNSKIQKLVEKWRFYVYQLSELGNRLFAMRSRASVEGSTDAQVSSAGPTATKRARTSF